MGLLDITNKGLESETRGLLVTKPGETSSLGSPPEADPEFKTKVQNIIELLKMKTEKGKEKEKRKWEGTINLLQ